MCPHLTPSPVGHFSLLEALTAHAPPLAGTAFTSYRLLRLKNLFLVASFTSLILLPCAELWFQKLPVTCVQMRPHPAVPVQVHLAPPSPPVSTEARSPPTPVPAATLKGTLNRATASPGCARRTLLPFQRHSGLSGCRVLQTLALKYHPTFLKPPLTLFSC